MRRFLFSTIGACFAFASLHAFAEQIVISEIMYNPPGDLPEYIELSNNTATPLDMAEWRLRGGVDYDFPAFAAGNAAGAFYGAYERVVLSSVAPSVLRAAYNIPPNVRIFGPWTGNLDNAGERITLRDKNGVTLCEVEYNDRGHWPRAADGAGHSLVLADPDGRIDDWRNWKASQKRLGTPGTEPILEEESPLASPEVNLAEGIPFVEYGDTWSYLADGSNQGTAWRNPGFNDGSWPSGPGLLGQESSSIPEPIRTATPAPQSGGPTTIYYRTKFNYNGSASGVTISVDLILDDGAVIYLNGQELGRVGMPGGTINFDTFSSRTVGNAVEEANVITAGGGALVEGENVLAAEVHQTNTGSSDTVFGLRFKISSPTQPSLVINEVQPGGSGAGFVEFYNPGGSPVNLLNHYLTDDPGNLTQHRITSNVLVPSGGLASVGYAESGLAVANPVVVYLTGPDGATTINAVRADVPLDGRSFGRKPTGSGSWFLFAEPTRNAPNNSQSSLAGALKLNEIHFSASNTVDWVEFYNAGEAALPLDGLFLSSESDFSNKVTLVGSVPSRGYASQNFAFPAGGGDLTLYLVNASDTVLAARFFERSALGDSLQAFPPGADEWYGSSAGSRDLANNPPRHTDVVINEIMYDPPSDEVSGEFIELYNRGASPVDVSGWRMADGVDFTIPNGTVIPPNGYLVLAADVGAMQAAYGAVPAVGNWSGRLSNSGELIRLEDAWGGLVDQVDYLPGGRWPTLANGDGTSMELRNPLMDNDRPSAWADSDETNKTSFIRYAYSDVFRQLRADGSASDYKELHLHLVGDSHVELANIQVRQNGSGANLIQNGHRMSEDCCSASGWLAQGTHYATHIDAAGHLNIIADGHGDNRPNRVEIDATGMNANQTYEVSFDARWVAGAPRLIVQTWDHSIATSIALPVPRNLGTPGFVNSKFIPTPAPQVDDLLHAPPVPSAGETVRVTARITSAAAGPDVRLYHRLDNSNGDGNWSNKNMFDDGFNGGDAVAGDGIYSAELTEYGSNGQIVQFYVQATGGGQTSRMPKWGANRPAMYVVDNPSSDDLRRMRFVVSAFDQRALSNQDSPTGSYGYNFPRLSNHYFNTTAIVNEERIIYNAEIRNSGSPWTRGGSLDRGKYKFPKDQLFRGKEKYSFDNDASGGSRHHNRLVRYWLYLLGHPVNENEYIRVEINNGGTSLREEVEPLGNDLLNRNYEEGSQGELYRIDDEWWFQDNWSRNSRNADWSYKGTDNQGRYRTEWMKRTREDEDDFSALIGFFQKINSGYTQSEIERLIDPLAMMKMSAVRGYIHDWDSFTLNRGKNGYFYRRSTDGLFMFFHWDSDLAFRSGDINSSFYNGMTGFRPYIEKPYNFRLFKHYLTRLVEEFTASSPRMNAWIQAENDASSQISVSSFYQGTWFPGRNSPARNLIGSGINTAFNITSNGGNPISTSASTLSLSGTSPLRAYTVIVAGHPEAEFSWTSETGWTLSGIQLQGGSNVLIVQAVDEEGHVLHADTITVNKSGNAAPVMDLDADPNSWHLSVLDVLEIDAGDSYDPDGTPLTFTWSVTPPGAGVDTSAGDRATAVFQEPGIYRFNVTGRDGGGASASAQREAVVFAADGFSSFNEPVLESWWRFERAELRGNYVLGTYYSVTEEDGHLVLHVQSDRARPLAGSFTEYPFVWRALPPSADWALQTKVDVRGQVFGDYMTGLMAETDEGGRTRYAFGIENGNSLSVKRANSTGAVTVLRTAALAENRAEIRIRRAGNILYFEWEADDVWSTFHTVGLISNTSAQKGGLFLATDTAQTIKAAFDYMILVDPTATTDLARNLRVSEIMYNPAGGSEFEYVELVNVGSSTLDLTGVQFVDGITYTFGSTVLAPGQYVVVVPNQTAFASRYSLAGLNIAAGEFEGRLDNDGETIVLADALGVPFLSVSYENAGDWPSAPNGSGSSLEVIDPHGNLNDGGNWRASPEDNGSPGRAGGNSLGTVVVNEVLTHTDFPLEDAIEIHNHTGASIDIGGWYLSDSNDEFKKFRIPDSTVIAAGGYEVFYEIDLYTNNTLIPFSLNSADGEEVYLSAADAAGNLTGYQNSVAFDAAKNGVSFGRHATSVGVDFPPLVARTLGADTPATLSEFRGGTGLPNAAPRVGPVVINELMYHPPDIGGTNDNTMDEFVELHNLNLSAVSLFDPAFPTNTWRLRGGADYDFPMGVSLPARGYLLVVGFDPSTNAAVTAAFRAQYTLPTSVPIHGPYSGKLDNGGENIKLVQPDTPQGPGPNEGFVPYVLVDRVDYGDASPWSASPDGAGDSLQRRRPFDYGNDPVNWKGAEPTPGRANVQGADFVDTDGDGLPDGFEIAQGLDENDPADAAEDDDGDGKTNYEEFLDGTDWQNSSDRLRAPSITAQPDNAQVAAGAGADFSVAAEGTAPLSYQWRFNGLPLAGATNSSLTVNNVQLANVGSYDVVVANADGFVVSDSVQLSVVQSLTILAQPLSQDADVGGTAQFSVFAVGTGDLTYQWMFDGADLPGETSDTLVLQDVQPGDAGNYSVRIGDDESVLTSAQATLTVFTPPTIAQQPRSQTVVAYNTVFMSVMAEGQGPFRYQWRFNGLNLVDQTNSVLVLENVQPNQAGAYSVQVLNPVSSVTSDDAILNILIPATIVQQPQSQQVDPGTDVTLSVTATSSSPMTYQWRFNDADIPSATGTSLFLPDVQDPQSGNYTVVVTDDIGSVVSDIAVLTVLTAPQFVLHPLSHSVVEGGNATFSVEVTGGLPMYYRWRVSFFNLEEPRLQVLNSRRSFTTVSNVTLADATNYTVVVSNAANPFGLLSQIAWLTVLPDTDQDGMPDQFENLHGLDPSEPADAALDGDGDGVGNRDEYNAGTDPGDPGDYLAVETLALGAGATVTFNAASNKTYSVEYTDVLDSGLWMKLRDVAAHATNHVETILDPNFREERYYRIVTPRQPGGE